VNNHVLSFTRLEEPLCINSSASNAGDLPDNHSVELANFDVLNKGVKFVSIPICSTCLLGVHRDVI
jgi:hypothetical protein